MTIYVYRSLYCFNTLQHSSRHQVRTHQYLQLRTILLYLPALTSVEITEVHVHVYMCCKLEIAGSHPIQGSSAFCSDCLLCIALVLHIHHCLMVFTVYGICTVRGLYVLSRAEPGEVYTARGRYYPMHCKNQETADLYG